MNKMPKLIGLCNVHSCSRRYTSYGKLQLFTYPSTLSFSYDDARSKERDSSQMSLLQMSRADCQSSYCKLLMSIVPIVHSSKCPKENEDICMPFNCRHACGPLCEVPDLWVLVMVG